ncbi:MAG: 2-hydroxyhepta-2,4-diene-1,7-dioate isomerase [Actinobacteria bacterium QS_5_72_10]|nr:MAG: 2-hydroxyhepta-2,4-diene-1,7-dioate isomerase [Actinobacteria bacterium QS_5_72_10]
MPAIVAAPRRRAGGPAPAGEPPPWPVGFRCGPARLARPATHDANETPRDERSGLVRFARVQRPGGAGYALVRDTEQGLVAQLIDGVPFGNFTETDQVAPLEQVRLLAPVIPTKVLVVGPDDAIGLPAQSDEVHHEAELAVIIGGLARHVPPDQAGAHIAGYTCANDVTARDLQARDGQWTRAKGFDTFCPLGPWLDTDLDPTQGVRLQCRVNGDTRQDGTTADLVFGVAELVSFCSQFATLLPGDVLLTGTPAGVGPIADGDRVEVDIDGLGTLANSVQAEAG